MNPGMVQAYFDYINERESIRLKRLNGDSPPWTDDPALREYRFTNVRRSDDKTTRALIDIYTRYWHADYHEIILNAAIYRCVGTAEFAQEIGWQTSYDPDRIIDLVRSFKKRKLKPWTGAYIITNQGIQAPKEEVVAKVHVGGIWERSQEIADVARETRSYEKVHGVISSISGFGGTGFMAKEVCMDLQLTPVLGNAKDRFTWSPVGPGAMRGLNWIHDRPPRRMMSQKQGLEELRELRNISLDYTTLSLSVSDCQFCACEFNKLCSIRAGGRGKRRYTQEP